MPPAGRQGQTFQATAYTYNGQTVYQFGDGLDTNQVIDADASGNGQITLWHCSCGNTNQLWWLARDANMPAGAYYIHNERFGDCLTYNGQQQSLSLKPCATGNKAQQWYLP